MTSLPQQQQQQQQPQQNASSSTLHARHVLESHDDIARPYVAETGVHASLPTRANRESARHRLTLIKSRPPMSPSSSSSPPPPPPPPPSEASAVPDDNVTVSPHHYHEIFLRAREMCEQSEGAFLKGVLFRRDAMRDWLAMVGLRVAAIILIAIRGARPLLYVETLLFVFYDLPALLAAVWMLQLLVAYSTAVSIVDAVWSLAELITWFVHYQFTAHHRHFNGGAFVGWLGFVVLLGLLCVTLVQMRNFANLLDAILLHAETVTTMVDVSRSATHDAAFRYNATEAGHALASATNAAPTPMTSTTTTTRSTTTAMRQWAATVVPILGRLWPVATTTTTTSSGATAALSNSRVQTQHVKAV